MIESPSFWMGFLLQYDTRGERSKIRCKLACKRIFDLDTRQKHEKVAIFEKNERISNVFEDCEAIRIIERKRKKKS